MEKKLNKKALIVSLVFALISCGLVFTYIKSLDRPQPETEMVKLLVATRNIKAGEEIKAADMTSINIPKEAFPEGVLNERKNIEGMYAKDSIIASEPFRAERLAQWEELTLSFNIPKNMRAISVFVNENSIFSNQLRVGDKVDIIGNFSLETEGGKRANLSNTIIQNVEVLAIGPNRVQKNTNTEISQNSDNTQLPRTVTLCVTLADAEKMSFTSAFADYALALRSNEDEKQVNTPGVIISDLVPLEKFQSTLNPLKEGDE